MHGTGTRIGDPVEIRALASTMGTGSAPCLLTAAKMHFGHLESAAGGLGLLKALAILQRKQVPAYSVLPGVNPMVAEAMKSSRLSLVTQGAAPLGENAIMGVSSFGFTGNNAHVVLKGPRGAATAAVPMPKSAVPAYPRASVAMPPPARTLEVVKAAPQPTAALMAVAAPTATAKASKIQDVIAVCQELGLDVPAGTPGSASVIDLGLDSLGIAELSARLGLPGGVDSIFRDPSLASIAAMMSPGEPVAAPLTAAPAAAAPAPAKAGGSLQAVIAVCQELGLDVPAGTPSSASVIDLGLDSLGIAELSARLGLPGGVDSIFRDPSLASIAAMVSPGEPVAAPVTAAPAAAAAAPAPAKAGGSLQAVIAVCQELGLDVPAGTPGSASVIDLGLDSLGIAELSARLGLPGGVDSIFRDPSLASIAAMVAPNSSAAPEQVDTAPESDADGCLCCHGPPIAEGAASLAQGMAAALATVRDACAAVGLPLSATVSSRLSVLDLGLKEGEQMAALASRLGLPGPQAIMKDPSLQAIAALVAKVTSATVAMPPPSLQPAHAVSLAVNGSIQQSSVARSQEESDAGIPGEGGVWIKTTHVGSLPRRKGASLEEMVDAQLEAGLTVINDGEMTRADYVTDMLSRIEGVHGEGEMVEMPMASDMMDAPQHSRRFSGINGLITLNKASPARSKLVCVEQPRYVAGGAAQCTANIQPLIKAAADRGLPPSSCFWSVPSPGTVALFCKNSYFSDYTTYVNALADALRPEYEAIASTGVMLQVRCPILSGACVCVGGGGGGGGAD